MIDCLYNFWVKYLTQKYKFLATILLLPLLYFVGFILAQPITLIKPSLSHEDVSLIGTIFTFLLFMLVLPSWIRVRWNITKPWLAIGLFTSGNKTFFRMFAEGIAYSFALIVLIFIILFCGSWGKWIGQLHSFEVLVNAILLGIGVGFAEELIFRGWLWGEVDMIFGARCGVFIQAAIFSLAHLPFTLGYLPILSLSLGLFLFGIVLAIRRVLDKGSLIGCMSLHGGLVSFWFLLRAGLVDIADDRPIWLFGPRYIEPNPLAGAVAIITFMWIIWYYRIAFAMMREPLRGARSASSNGAIP